MGRRSRLVAFNKKNFMTISTPPINGEEKYAIALAVSCPFCKAAKGDRCTPGPAFPQYQHKTRFDAAWDAIANAGYRARVEGKDLVSDNPHSHCNSLHWKWREGFLDAARESLP